MTSFVTDARIAADLFAAGQRAAVEVDLGFRVEGEPVTQGSLQTSRSGHAYYANGKALKAWRRKVEKAAATIREECGIPVFDGAVEIRIVFVLPRPQGHFGTHGNLLPSAPDQPIKQPDLDKLGRAIQDALTGVLYYDDSQIVELSWRKEFDPRRHATGEARVRVGSATRQRPLGL